MPRLIQPTEFDKQIELTNNIHTKVVADGSNSAIKLFNEQQGIDTAKDVGTGAEALVFDKQSKTLTKEKEELRQLRDLKADPVFARVRGMIQTLKTFFAPNFGAVGAWGADITATGKVNFPADFKARVTLFNDIKTKHDSYAAGQSPLDAYLALQDINLVDDGKLLEKALIHHIDFMQKEKDAEQATEDRNIKWAIPLANQRKIGAYLMDICKNNEKALGAYGFTVDNATPEPKERLVKILLGSEKTITGVKIGTIVVNTSTFDVLLFKGKKAEGEPVTLAPNEKFGIVKGYSSITIKNLSNTETATLKVVSTK